jgi:molybdopterin-guanine dinucleotide biosynthesis protein A
MATAIVLAGGLATRLGGDKAGALLAGRPLIEHVLDAVADAGLHAAVVAKSGTRLPHLDCQIVIEPDEPRHPLCGVVAGLRAVGEPVVVCACDMPFVTGPLLAWLSAQEDRVVVAGAGGRVQPLLGRYDSSLLPALELMLARAAPMWELVRDLDARIIKEVELSRFGDPRRLCANINTVAELAAAEG